MLYFPTDPKPIYLDKEYNVALYRGDSEVLVPYWIHEGLIDSSKVLVVTALPAGEESRKYWLPREYKESGGWDYNRIHVIDENDWKYSPSEEFLSFLENNFKVVFMNIEKIPNGKDYVDRLTLYIYWIKDGYLRKKIIRSSQLDYIFQDIDDNKKKGRKGGICPPELVYTNCNDKGFVLRQIEEPFQGFRKTDKRGVAISFQDPPKAIKKIIEIIKEEGIKFDIILDPYAGTCSTLIAARDVGIPSIGIEIREDICDIGIGSIKLWDIGSGDNKKNGVRKNLLLESRGREVTIDELKNKNNPKKGYSKKDRSRMHD